MAHMTKPTELDRVAARYERQRTDAKTTRDNLKALVVAEHSNGASEVSLAQRAGVDRLTIRAWLGKGRTARAV